MFCSQFDTNLAPIPWTSTKFCESLKVVSAIFLLVWFLSLNESTCQTRKNVFYFTSKALYSRKNQILEF